nr:hypothetical protein [Aliamphritea spongicola]
MTGLLCVVAGLTFLSTGWRWGCFPLGDPG